MDSVQLKGRSGCLLRRVELVRTRREPPQGAFVFRYCMKEEARLIVEHGRNEVGAEVLLVISREFGKSLEWLLTGEELFGHRAGPINNNVART